MKLLRAKILQAKGLKFQPQTSGLFLMGFWGLKFQTQTEDPGGVIMARDYQYRVIMWSLAAVWHATDDVNVMRFSRYSSSILWGSFLCVFNVSHSIHVWYIYLHLVDFYGTCR